MSEQEEENANISTQDDIILDEVLQDQQVCNVPFDIKTCQVEYNDMKSPSPHTYVMIYVMIFIIFLNREMVGIISQWTQKYLVRITM